MFVVGLLTMDTIIYLCKIAFEMNYGISRFSNGLEFFSLLCQLTSMICIIILLKLKRNYFIDLYNPNDFVDLSFFIRLDRLTMLTLSGCAMFYPFRLFLFFSHFTFGQPIKD